MLQFHNKYWKKTTDMVWTV